MMPNPLRSSSIALGHALLAAGALGVLVSAGCAASDGATNRTSADAEAGDADAGDADGGPSLGTDGGGPPESMDAGTRSPPMNDEGPTFDGTGALSTADSCFDRLDNDLSAATDATSDGFDCADPGCQLPSVPTCCVGRSAADCCESQPDWSKDFSSCAALGLRTVDSCATDARLFGGTDARLGVGGLLVTGTAASDSGLLVPGVLDPRTESLTLTATMTMGQPPTSEQVNAMSFGLLPAGTDPARSSRVGAALSVVVSPSLDEVRLVVGDVVAWRTSLSALGASEESEESASSFVLARPIEYVLGVQPEGTATLDVRTTAGTSLASTEPIAFVAESAMQVAVWGRSTNPDPGAAERPPLAMQSLVVEHALCDAPTALERPLSGSILPNRAQDPSFWQPASSVGSSSTAWTPNTPGRTPTLLGRMAFEMGERIYLARPLEDGRFRPVQDSLAAAPVVLGPSDALPWMQRAVLEPELVAEDEHWVLYFVGVANDGKRSIGRAVGGPGFGETFPTPSLVTGLQANESTDFDGPDHVASDRPFIPSRLLAVRTSDRATGRTAIALFTLAATTGSTTETATRITNLQLPQEPSGLRTSDIVHEPTSGLGFDADEVASPSLVIVRDVLRLYYAGRRGTRWSIGLRVSPDGVHWLEAGGGAAVLGATGRGFDALSVADPDAVVMTDPSGGARSTLRLYYAGSDGRTESVGLAAQPILDGSPR